MQAGFGVSLGLGSEVTDEELALAIEKYSNSSLEISIDQPGTNDNSIDGLGVTRIAEKLVQEIQGSRNGIQQAVAAT